MRVLLGVLSLIVLGVVFGLVVVEAALAVANVAPVEDLRYLPAWADVQHRLYGWFHYPNSEFVYRTRTINFGTRVRINSKGLREREYDYEKPPGTYRVLILGDSFVPSLEVPFEQIWHELLERRFSDATGGQARVEVIGAGVQGWSIDQQLLYYRHEGYKYGADLVMFQTYLSNDIIEADMNLDRLADRGLMKYQKPYFVLMGDQLVLENFPYQGEGYWVDSQPVSSLAGRIKYVARRNSRVYRFVTRTVLPRRRPQAPQLPYGCWATPTFNRALMVYATDYPEEFVAGWRLYDRLLEELNTEVLRRGARFAAVSFPNWREVIPEAWEDTLECWPEMKAMSWDLEKPDRLLSEALRKRGADFLGVAAPLRRAYAADGRSPYIERDHHFNPYGHALVADVVYDWLKEANLVPR